jgi:hypothetical protein
MIYERFCQHSNDRTVSAVIGMPKAKFDLLARAFAAAGRANDEERVRRGEIKQLPVGGPKGYLDTPEKKLFFVLYYLKTYPTFDVPGFHFGLSGGHAHDHIEALLPVLGRALDSLGLMPGRDAKTPQEFAQAIVNYNNILIDGVECACVRPQDDTRQKARYSGKKKTHGQDLGGLRP